MLRLFASCLYYDLCVILRHPWQCFHPIIFFLILIALFGIGLGFDAVLLRQVSPAIVWIAFLITSLLTVETLFRREEEEGTLEQLLVSAQPLWWVTFAKSLALWVASCLPLILIMPFVGVALQLQMNEIVWLTLSVLIGSPALTFMGVLGAALTIAMPRSGVFLGLLLLPLYIPILILGISAVVSLLDASLPLFQISLLGAISILAITLVPHCAAAALKAGYYG
ncbi:MAG: heme exporter protein CcmB [Candidatus Berkiellales bacterium]